MPALPWDFLERRGRFRIAYGGALRGLIEAERRKADEKSKKPRTPRDVWRDAVRASTSLSGARKLVLETVATLADPDLSNAWPSAQRIAERCGRSDDAVRRHLDAAESAGWLRRIPCYRSNGAATTRLFAFGAPDSDGGAG